MRTPPGLMMSDLRSPICSGEKHLTWNSCHSAFNHFQLATGSLNLELQALCQTHSPCSVSAHSFSCLSSGPSEFLSCFYQPFCTEHLPSRLGANISNLPLSLPAIGFHLGLGAIFCLYAMFWLQLNMFQVIILDDSFTCYKTSTFTSFSDCEVPGGAGCGDLPLWQLLAFHHCQKREEGRVNLGGTL